MNKYIVRNDSGFVVAKFTFYIDAKKFVDNNFNLNYKMSQEFEPSKNWI